MIPNQKTAARGSQILENKVYQQRRRARLKAEGYRPVTAWLSPEAQLVLAELKQSGRFPCNNTAISGVLENFVKPKGKD